MTHVIRRLCTMVAIAAAVFIVGCGRGGSDTSLKEVQRVKSGDLDIVLLSEDGALNQGKDAFVIEFRNADGSLVDAGTVSTSANMPMPGMTMSGNVQVERTDVPGRYRASGDFARSTLTTRSSASDAVGQRERKSGGAT